MENMTEFQEQKTRMQAKFFDDFQLADPVSQVSFMKQLENTFSNKKEDKKNNANTKNRRSTIRSPQKIKIVQPDEKLNNSN